MAYYNGREIGFCYNGKHLIFLPQVTIPTGESVNGHLITSDGLYFMTADNQEFIAKEESANG